MTSVFLTSIGSSLQSIASSCKSTLTHGIGASGAMIPNAFSSSLTAIQGLFGPLLEKRADQALEKSIAKLYDELQANKTGKNVLIEQFVRNNWALATAGIHVLQGQKNQEALYDKLFQILIPLPSCKEMTITICKNVVKNFQASGKETLERLSKDIESKDFKKLFSISGHPKISAITKLGEETHHKGRAPFLIELSDGTKIVYKPRSLAAEKHITASKNSLFSKLNDLGRQLGTYHVLDRGEYGYCEFIDNKVEDNTFRKKSDLKEYARNIAALDAVASSISLTDLHNGNIATRSGDKPIAIDCEAVMGPRMQLEGYRFDTMAMSWELNGPTVGWFADTGTINKVYWKESNELHCLGATSADNNFFFTYLERASKNASIRIKEEPIIEECKEKLKEHQHRFVLIDTETLTGMIKKTLNQDSKDHFIAEIQKRLDAYHISFDSSQTEAIFAQFTEDVMNHDVPLFYYHPVSGTAYYDQIPLGKKFD